MTSRDFCFWLQGFFEIAHCGPQPPEPYGGHVLNSAQVEIVKRHLALVFKHEIDPSMGPEPHQQALDAAHTPPTPPKPAGPTPPASSWSSHFPSEPGGPVVRC